MGVLYGTPAGRRLRHETEILWGDRLISNKE